MTKSSPAYSKLTFIKSKRVQSIDLLRGVVMIVMALDHVRDYFHADAFLYDPTDLSRTSIFLFFTRFITHYCAPVFVFLAGTSAYLSGTKRTRKELSRFLLTRGIWLVLLELFIIVLFRTFNPTYPYVHLQVIWAIGISMMALSAIIYMNRSWMLLTGILLIAAHNLLDNVHVPGNGVAAFGWSLLHDTGHFKFGYFSVFVHYPILPWIGIMTTGYYFGQLYIPGYDPRKRKNILLSLGCGALALFVILRSGNLYGDAAHWSVQKNAAFSLLSFLNVTKYPPSLLYTLITLGPAFIFLAFAEKPLNALTAKLAVYGRVPMFYYLAHILLIHVFATIGAMIIGYKFSDMILSDSVQVAPALKGYGFNLLVVYAVWIGLVLLLYPCCKWFDQYKRTHQSKKWWLSYL
ncbi:MAG: heparan-alpha-glucosaminide N-acetyltransferase domain-containing protein [Bacteroidota bacterium]|nr:heparan-alpha-glucosaminide N-acetyltransferase domain-containing protein [Bacteroidota bacterium]